MPGEHPVCSRSQAVDIAELGIRVLSRRNTRHHRSYLRSHGRVRSHGFRRPSAKYQLREAKVAHEYFIAGVQEKVPRLDVAVDQPSVVGTRYPLARFTRPPDSLTYIHAHLRHDPILDRPARHDFGDDVPPPLHNICVQDRQHVLATQAPQDLRLAPRARKDLIG